MRKITHEEYVKRLKEIHSNIEVLDTFINTQTKILHRCNIHNYEWMITPNNLLGGRNCPKCSGVYRRNHDDYVKELHDINPNIEVIGTYKNNKTKIEHRCVIHDYIWNVTPDGLLSGRNCPKCSGNYKRTHEDYVNELKELNPDLEVVGKFVGVDVKILHRCKTHNITFEKVPSSALRGSGCRKCGGDINASIFSKTHEEYVNELKELNPDITVVGNYINSKTKILHRCNIDNNEWYANPDNILRGNGCPICGGRFQRTHDEYVEILEIKYPNLEVLETYINSQTKILHRCKIHNYEWSIRPNSVIQGQGCPKCGNNYHMTHEDYVSKLKTINPYLEVVGVYKNIKEKIPHKCLIHNIVFDKYPESALGGSGCYICGSEKLSIALSDTHDDYLNKINKSNLNINVLEEYKGSAIKILHECKIDGYQWYARPANILSGCGCPKCNVSKGELKISKWLDEHNIIYECQKRFDECIDNKTLPFDFYIPNINACIEFDGEQHYRPVKFGGCSDERANKSYESTVKHDHIKNEYCKSHGINLIRIPYYKDIESELNLLFT